MTLSLKDAITKLYKPPPDGMRQVLAVSRAVAEKLPRLPGVAVISVTAPGRPPASLDGFEHIVRLSFADVDFMSKDLSARAKKKLPDAFRPRDSEEILKFLAGLPEPVRTVVVHCEGGYSRSCAIALALHQLHGYATELELLTDANDSVLRTMLGEARSRAQ